MGRTITLDQAVLGGAILALLYLIGAPLLMTVFTAFRGPVDFLPFEPGAQFTLDNLKAVYASGIFRDTLIDTAWFVGGATILAFVVAFVLAFLARLYHFCGLRHCQYASSENVLRLNPLVSGKLRW